MPKMKKQTEDPVLYSHLMNDESENDGGRNPNPLFYKNITLSTLFLERVLS